MASPRDGERATDVDEILESLTLAETLRLLHGARDPEGVSTGYVPPNEERGIPPLRLVDGPLGVRAGEATAFPASIALAAAWDADLARAQGEALGRETRAKGQDGLLAPGLNLIRVPNGGRNFEYYSEDPWLTSRMAVAVVEGIQSEGAIATAKHYVANSQETDRTTVDAGIDERALRECYLRGFEATVREAEVGSVMCAYNGVNGEPMSEHRRLLTELLRDEWGFSGYVVSDWWAIDDPVDSATAGLDLEMPGYALDAESQFGVAPSELPLSMPDVEAGGLYGDPLRAAVDVGTVSADRVETMARRVLETMDRFGLFSADRPFGAIDTDGHSAIARRVAIEGSVLLKNEGVLPFDSGIETLAVIGPNADRPALGGGGSSEVTPVHAVSPLDGLRERFRGEVTFERGIAPIQGVRFFDEREGEEPDDEPSIEDAVAAAEDADATVLVARDVATEGADRPSLSLPGEQDALIEAVAGVAEELVVVLNTGGAVEMPWLESVPSLLETWYPGQDDGVALAAVLTGEEPGGRLPVTFGRGADYGFDDSSYPGTDGRVEHDEGLLVGYRGFDARDREPYYPFGHGLSYAEFEYGPLEIPDRIPAGESATVSVPLENVGDRPGKEVVQVYVASEVEGRPPRELAGFSAARLAPGERHRVEVSLDPRAFLGYDPEREGWYPVTEEGTVEVGRSSRDLRGAVPVRITTE